MIEASGVTRGALTSCEGDPRWGKDGKHAASVGQPLIAWRVSLFFMANAGENLDAPFHEALSVRVEAAAEWGARSPRDGDRGPCASGA
jgi:hypothetical protein